MLKSAIRKTYSAARMQLAKDEIAGLSAAMLERFLTLSWSGINYFLSYYPLKTRNEFDLEACEKAIQAQSKSAKICWPVILTDGLTMEARTLADSEEFVENHFRIPEPVNGQLIDSQKIDLILIPLLAFDLAGYRVGYGKGFYDRYLKTCRADALKIGFSFFDPVDRIDDVNEFDVPLNLCITPARAYEF